MTQPTVPFWLVVFVVVIGAMVTAALAYQDPAFVIAPVIRFVLAITNVGLIALAAVLNIRSIPKTP